MPGGSNQIDPLKGIEIETLALRNAYPVGLRTWGMRVTVFNDPTPGNNGTYVLTYNYSGSTSKQENANWQFEFEAISRKHRANADSWEVLLEAASGGSIQVDIIAGALISDTDHLFIEIDWTAKSTVANTGAGGKHICSWTKAAGVLVRSFENDTLKGQNMAGAALVLTTVDSGGNIRAQLSQAAPPANFTVSWIARIVKRSA